MQLGTFPKSIQNLIAKQSQNWDVFLAHFNVRGFLSHQDELDEVLACLGYSKLVALTET